MADTEQKPHRNHVVPIATFNKWQLQFDKDYSTLSWLRCDSSDSLLETLWCTTCRRYESLIVGMKNFSRSLICGSKNQRSSNIIDHAKSEQHKVAMTRLCTEQAIDVWLRKIWRLDNTQLYALGESYQTKDSASAFTGYIALQQQNTFLSSFSKAHFFSF